MKKVSPQKGIKVWKAFNQVIDERRFPVLFSVHLSLFFLLRHWLTCSYILFAVPYFVYDIYAMFLCYWHKLQVKGHEVDNGSRSKAVAVAGYLRREFLMILHHVVMVTACFPISVVKPCVNEPESLINILTRIGSCSDLLFLSLWRPVLEAGKGRLLPGCHVPGWTQHSVRLSGKNPHPGIFIIDLMCASVVFSPWFIRLCFSRNSVCVQH